MADGKFVAYYRVSTDGQGRSGLGLAAQQETVRTFLNGGSWSLVGEFTEIESGRKSDRLELDAALKRCRLAGASLVVANVSRLTRNPDFMGRLVDAGVEVRFCDLPQVEGPAGKFMLRQMLAVAELEAGMIGERTRKALQAAKARGVRLGGTRWDQLTGDAGQRGRVASIATRTAAADKRAGDVAWEIAGLQSAGKSLRQIAETLNANGTVTARGKKWSAVQVSRILARAGEK